MRPGSSFPFLPFHEEDWSIVHLCRLIPHCRISWGRVMKPQIAKLVIKRSPAVPSGIHCEWSIRLIILCSFHLHSVSASLVFNLYYSVLLCTALYCSVLLYSTLCYFLLLSATLPYSAALYYCVPLSTTLYCVGNHGCWRCAVELIYCPCST